MHPGTAQRLVMRMTRADKERLIRLRDEMGVPFLSDVVRTAVHQLQVRLDRERAEAQA